MDTQKIEKSKVENLLKLYGSDTLSYFYLQDNRSYFFSPTGKSCLSYKLFNKVAIVPGDPLGPVEEIPLLLKSFLEYLSVWNFSPFFIGASSEYIKLLESKKMKTIKIGEEAIIDLSVFNYHQLKKKVRRAVRHTEELGVEVFFFNSINMPQNIRLQVTNLSADWIKGKGDQEKGFAMTLKRVPSSVGDKDCKFVVAVKDGCVLGYLGFVPCYPAKSLSLDHIRSLKNSPNGLHEFLIIKAVEYFKLNHINKISLNFAVFSNIFDKSYSKLHLRGKLSSIFMRLYKSDTLRFFNEKFIPNWQNRYVAYFSLLYLPQYILAILEAER